MRTEVPYIEDAKSWCTISYYEENKRYGELFQGEFFFYIQFKLNIIKVFIITSALTAAPDRVTVVGFASVKLPIQIASQTCTWCA